MTVEIALTRGNVALVDMEDGDLADYKWCTLVGGYELVYAARYVTVARRTKTVLLHREILARALGEPLTSTQRTDHINGDGLDNRRANLRVATPKENGRNRRISRNNTSGTTGVCWHKAMRKWRASIKADGQVITIGYFDDKADAADARRDAELQYFGEFSALLSRGTGQ